MTVAAVSAVLAFGLGGCTGDDEPGPQEQQRKTVTVEHPMGTTEVPLNPGTAVSLSPYWDDATSTPKSTWTASSVPLASTLPVTA